MENYGSFGVLCSLDVNSWHFGLMLDFSAIGIYVFRFGPLRVTVTRRVTL
jgi:hypothetical protein